MSTQIEQQPAPAPEQPRRPRIGRILAITGIAVAVLLAVIVTVSVATGGGTPKQSPPAPAASSPAPAPAVPTVTSWYNGGGKAELTAIATDEGKISTDMPALAAVLTSGADPSSAEALVVSDATQLSTDARTLLGNLPPGPSAPDISAAMVFYQTSATDMTTGVSDIVSGDIAGATAAFNAGTTAEQNGTAKIQDATSIISGS